MSEAIIIPVKNYDHLLIGVPKGDWVVLANDQERMIAHGPDLDALVQIAKESGENLPFITKVPDIDDS
jgi:hypothetical protein